MHIIIGLFCAFIFIIMIKSLQFSSFLYSNIPFVLGLIIFILIVVSYFMFHNNKVKFKGKVITSICFIICEIIKISMCMLFLTCITYSFNANNGLFYFIIGFICFVFQILIFICIVLATLLIDLYIYESIQDSSSLEDLILITLGNILFTGIHFFILRICINEFNPTTLNSVFNMIHPWITKLIIG